MIGQIQRFRRRKTLVACMDPEREARAQVIFAAACDPAIEAAGEDLRNKFSGFTSAAPGESAHKRGAVRHTSDALLPFAHAQPGSGFVAPAFPVEQFERIHED
jgi:hypothetical protein